MDVYYQQLSVEEVHQRPAFELLLLFSEVSPTLSISSCGEVSPTLSISSCGGESHPQYLFLWR